MTSAKLPVQAKAGHALNQVLFPGAGIARRFALYLLALAAYIAAALAADGVAGPTGAVLGWAIAGAFAGAVALVGLTTYRLVVARDHNRSLTGSLRAVAGPFLLRCLAQAAVLVGAFLAGHGVAQLLFAQPQMALAAFGLLAYPAGIVVGLALALRLTPWRSWAALGAPGGLAASWRACRGHGLRVFAGYAMVALGVGIAGGFLILFGTYFVGQAGLRLDLPGVVTDGLNLAVLGVAGYGGILAVALYEAAWLAWLDLLDGPGTAPAPASATDAGSAGPNPRDRQQAEAG